ncbi:MAG: thioredoxin family protein [Taibaiella sp.]|nr:thioredoxin family protein [Taibaiella sp.]
MKRIMLFASAMMLLAALHAEEIKYYNKSWAEIKARAKKEHKYIFIDCYTDWCGWCKVMDKETMVQPEIVNTLNGKFVPVKMDMEHGEGILMAMKYHVTGFPSFLVFDENGRYVYQSAGYQKLPEFSKMLSEATDKSKQISAPGYSASLEMNYPLFYKNAFAGNGKRTFPPAAEVEKWLSDQKDLKNEVSWAVISRFAGDAKYAGYFLEHLDEYRNLYGKVGVNDKLNSLLGQQLEAIMKSKDDGAFEVLLQSIDKYMGADAVMSRVYCSIAYYKATENWPKYVAAAGEYISRQGVDNASYINTICWDIYEKCEDKDAIANACKWMKDVVDKEGEYAYLDTYAALLHKSGDDNAALTWAEQAVEKGKAGGKDVKGTEELITKIKSGK